jgi:Cys-rich four helix bundle protein (predicted Tat secretion target)
MQRRMTDTHLDRGVTRRALMAAGAATLALRALPAMAEPAAADRTQALARAASECVRAGEVCLQHCLDLLATGDTSVGDCAKVVTQMLAVCRAVGPIADARGKYVPAMAALCLSVCTDCEQACRKHADKHEVCKACADACEKTAAAAKALGA